MTTETHVAHLLPAFVAGTLAPAHERAVRDHLERCPVCRAELAAWQAIGRSTRDRYSGFADGAASASSHRLHPAGGDSTGVPMASARDVVAAAAPAAPARIVHRTGVILATAALILLTLASTLVMGSVRSGGFVRETPLLSLLAPEALEPPAAVDPATRQGVLLTVQVPALPASADVVAIQRWTFPATTAPITTLPATGPVLLYVNEGSLTVSLDGAGAIISGPDDTPEPVTLPMEQRVRAGQTLVIPRNARATLANPSATATFAIVVEILEGDVDDWVVPWDQQVIELERLVSSTGRFPSGPATVTLSRRTLATGETHPAPPPGTYQRVAAESTFLGYLARPPDGSVINREPDALDVLILTISPVPAAPATPAS